MPSRSTPLVVHLAAAAVLLPALAACAAKAPTPLNSPLNVAYDCPGDLVDIEVRNPTNGTMLVQMMQSGIVLGHVPPGSVTWYGVQYKGDRLQAFILDAQLPASTYASLPRGRSTDRARFLITCSVEKAATAQDGEATT